MTPTCILLDLETLRYRLILPKNLPGHCTTNIWVLRNHVASMNMQIYPMCCIYNVFNSKNSYVCSVDHIHSFLFHQNPPTSLSLFLNLASFKNMGAVKIEASIILCNCYQPFHSNTLLVRWMHISAKSIL